MAEPLALSIVIVNWNVRALLRDCLASLRKQGLADTEVIVVDNASADDSAAMVAEEFPEVRLIESGRNLGFAGGCEEGYRVSSGRFILLLNPDTVVLDGAIQQMMADMAAHPEVAAIGSRLQSGDGSFQRAGGGAFPSLANVAWNYLFLNRLLPAAWAPPAMFLENDPEGLFDVDWVSGAALLLRRDAVGERIFSGDYFMFGEDMELCDRLCRQGWRVVYSANQSIVHLHGQSLKTQSSLEVLANVYKGPRRFFQSRRGGASVFAYDAILLVGYSIRWPLFRMLSALRPGRGYDELARFSRQYLTIMLKLMGQR